MSSIFLINLNLKYKGHMRRREYFLVGRGLKSIVVYIAEQTRGGIIEKLNCDNSPSDEQISVYRQRLVGIEWYLESEPGTEQLEN